MYRQWILTYKTAYCKSGIESFSFLYCSSFILFALYISYTLEILLYSYFKSKILSKYWQKKKKQFISLFWSVLVYFLTVYTEYSVQIFVIFCWRNFKIIWGNANKKNPDCVRYVKNGYLFITNVVVSGCYSIK